MAQFDTIRTGAGTARAAQIDEGLRAHMNKVYALMSVAMLLTAAVAWAVGTNEAMIAAACFRSSGSAWSQVSRWLWWTLVK